jgi:hypothetical protein
VKQVTNENNMAKSMGTMVAGRIRPGGHELCITGFGVEKDATMMDRRGQRKF